MIIGMDVDKAIELGIKDNMDGYKEISREEIAEHGSIYSNMEIKRFKDELTDIKSLYVKSATQCPGFYVALTKEELDQRQLKVATMGRKGDEPVKIIAKEELVPSQAPKFVI